jgi:hypothetical protein
VLLLLREVKGALNCNWQGNLEMAYLIYYKNEDDIVVVKVFEEISINEYSPACDKALQMCMEKNCSEIVFDMNELKSSCFTITDFFLFGKTIPHGSLGIFCNFVLPSDAKLRSEVKYICTVAKNHGALVNTFNNFNEAMGWLVQKRSNEIA